ncbi:MAG: hypothetical protein AAB365_04210 [Patescibacteria group bacterium]
MDKKTAMLPRTSRSTPTTSPIHRSVHAPKIQVPSHIPYRSRPASGSWAIPHALRVALQTAECGSKGCEHPSIQLHEKYLPIESAYYW